MGASVDGAPVHAVVKSCALFGSLFVVLCALSVVILVAVNWRPWRIYSWIFARRWRSFMQGHRLSIITAVLAAAAWTIVLSPIAVLILWGARLIILLNHDTIGLAVILAGTALLLAFYAIMLWWRTQWQSSRAVAILLLLAVSLLCAYELSAVYVTAGRSASISFLHQLSFSGFQRSQWALTCSSYVKWFSMGQGLMWMSM